LGVTSPSSSSLRHRGIYPVHRDAAAVLRREFQQPRLVPVGDDLTRDLADYDRAFGLVEGSN
tara:strand:- start:449 stop:634 length:186 start_codon:yes stop_codon:yes gene_type:complete